MLLYIMKREIGETRKKVRVGSWDMVFGRERSNLDVSAMLLMRRKSGQGGGAAAFLRQGSCSLELSSF